MDKYGNKYFENLQDELPRKNYRTPHEGRVNSRKEEVKDCIV